MIQTKAHVVKRESERGHVILTLKAAALAMRLGPGQPILVRPGPGLDPYLPRTFHPLSIQDDLLSIRIPPDADRGHAWLRARSVGETLDCLGPVGRGFRIAAQARRLLCLGEGEWAWTLLSLVEKAVAQGVAVTLAVEATSATRAIPAQRLPLAVEYRLATVDGSRGRRGRISTLLPELLSWADAVAAAGTMAFYQTLAAAIEEQRLLLRHGYAQALYPSTFFCGVGACQTCARDVAGGRRRVCLRGPVFDLADIV
ncbi:MAG: hypothetical protein GXP42_07920 [Chloroflexi bacterium]|nr:hypothetical protein [Chloroflexota bacterium]